MGRLRSPLPILAVESYVYECRYKKLRAAQSVGTCKATTPITALFEPYTDRMSSIGAWQFTPLVTAFPTNVLPNVGFYKASNGSWEYQIQLAWPLNWTSQAESTTVETM